MNACPARARGFTLVEVLIVLVLTSLITLTLFSAFRTGIKSWRTAEDHLQRVEGARQLLNVVHRHLFQVSPVVLMFPDRTEFAFSGTASSLRYVAPLSMSAGGELYVVELFSDEGGSPGVWGRFVPYSPQGMDEASTDTEASLISEDMVISFQYYGATDASGEEIGWGDSWAGRPEFPQLVRISFTGGRHAMPPVVMRVGAG